MNREALYLSLKIWYVNIARDGYNKQNSMKRTLSEPLLYPHEFQLNTNDATSTKNCLKEETRQIQMV